MHSGNAISTVVGAVGAKLGTVVHANHGVEAVGAIATLGFIAGAMFYAIL